MFPRDVALLFFSEISQTKKCNWSCYRETTMIFILKKLQLYCWLLQNSDTLKTPSKKKRKKWPHLFVCSIHHRNPCELFFLPQKRTCDSPQQSWCYRKWINNQLHLRIQQNYGVKSLMPHCLSSLSCSMLLTRVFPFEPPFPLRSTNMVSILFPSHATSLFLWPSY